VVSNSGFVEQSFIKTVSGNYCNTFYVNINSVCLERANSFHYVAETSEVKRSLSLHSRPTVFGL
jgi:hypothetical protein